MMHRITIGVLVLLGLFGWSISAPAQQDSMLARVVTPQSSIELSEVTCDFGQEADGKIAVSWKVDLTNKDPKDHIVDVWVRFFDAQKAEAFHDSVTGSKVPANGTFTVSHTTTVEATKARSATRIEASATTKR